MCMDRCCAQRDCNVAYMVDKNCFSVACYSPILCKISDVSATNGDVEISTILNSTAEKPAEKRKSLFSPVACLSLHVFVLLFNWMPDFFRSWKKSKRISTFTSIFLHPYVRLLSGALGVFQISQSRHPRNTYRQLTGSWYSFWCLHMSLFLPTLVMHDLGLVKKHSFEYTSSLWNGVL